MAITKIWSIKSRLDVSLNYIENPDKTELIPDIDAVEGAIKYIANTDKTDKCLYVKAFNCSVESAYKTMTRTHDKWYENRRKNEVIAYHLVQSFKDFETTPEIAHQCGMELVNRLFEDKYEVVLATHTDQDHLHNHIIINAVSFVDGKKYRRSFKDYFIDIRGISDQICREHCLSVIDNPSHSGMHYAEWKALHEGKPTIRGRMRAELDEIISASYSFKEFWRALERNGYVIHRKGENISHTSIVPPFGKRPIRLDSLGKDYTEDAIAERIRAARNGIWLTPPSQIRRTYHVRGNLRNYKRKKLKGFMALYFRYLYMFGKIQRKQAPKKVSFFMRDELIKFERYKKQYHFLCSSQIETTEQLEQYQHSQEDEMKQRIVERTRLYKERRNPEAAENAAARIAEINIELRALRANVRMCKAIMVDAQRIAERQRQLEELRKQEEVKSHEPKRRNR